MQAGQTDVGKGVQRPDDSGESAVFIAVAKAAALLLHQHLLRAERGDIAVDPYAHGKKAVGKRRKAPRATAAPRWSPVHQPARKQDVRENLPVLDGAVIDHMGIRKTQALRQPVFRVRDDLRVKACSFI